MSGDLNTEVGLIASWASCAPEADLISPAKYSAPYLPSI